MTEALPVRRAILSVADKEGLVPFGRGLAGLGIRLVSTGSTAETLADGGVEVTPVSEVTGFPEMLDGRVKTLHPAIHAGILVDKRNPAHMQELDAQGFEAFDLVVVNLYPFEQAVRSGAGPEEIIEQIDIGGPTLIRAAAKNHRSIAVVVQPSRYAEVLGVLEAAGEIDPSFRARLADEAFAHVAVYDAAIAAWFSGWAREPGFPEQLALGLDRIQELRYGENPHQAAALYRVVLGAGPLGGAEVLQGKEMSFNNWLDAEAARAVASSFEDPAAVIVKHQNPSGAAVAGTLADAYRGALASDPVAAFGGVVAFSDEVDGAAAEAMSEVFTEVVVAPGYSKKALAAFAERKNLRVLRAPAPAGEGWEIRPIEGGALVQDADRVAESRGEMRVATKREPTEEEWADLLFAWRVVVRVKSNAIVLAADRATVGVGAGQVSRVESVDIACRKAEERALGSAMASDAFFPFRDGIDRAARSGVRSIIQPGGSVRDPEVIDAANEHGMAMVLTDRRHFRH